MTGISIHFAGGVQRGSQGVSDWDLKPLNLLVSAIPTGDAVTHHTFQRVLTSSGQSEYALWCIPYCMHSGPVVLHSGACTVLSSVGGC